MRRAVAYGFLILSGTAAATDVPAAAGGEEPVPGEVVVTAQKRAESILTVPISITALSQESLEDQNIKDITDLSRVSPRREPDAGGLPVHRRPHRRHPGHLGAGRLGNDRHLPG